MSNGSLDRRGADRDVDDSAVASALVLTSIFSKPNPARAADSATSRSDLRHVSWYATSK
jgi:hypothetical protein